MASPPVSGIPGVQFTPLLTAKRVLETQGATLGKEEKPVNFRSWEEAKGMEIREGFLEEASNELT